MKTEFDNWLESVEEQVRTYLKSIDPDIWNRVEFKLKFKDTLFVRKPWLLCEKRYHLFVVDKVVIQDRIKYMKKRRIKERTGRNIFITEEFLGGFNSLEQAVDKYIPIASTGDGYIFDHKGNLVYHTTEYDNIPRWTLVDAGEDI